MKNSTNTLMRESDVSQKLLQICNMICSSYTELQKEFSDISNILNITESAAVAYSNTRHIKMHMKSYEENLDLNLLKQILKKLEEIKAGSKEEFLGNIDFLNILVEIFDKKDMGEIIAFVWEAKKKLKYIVYEIDRINNTEDENKKVAILKGMIAYY